MKTYAVKETFRTIQGEGYHAGTPAFFIRFAGCNMWTGQEHDRERDARRNGAECPKWCDTDFKGGRPLPAQAIADLAAVSRARLIVLTGGEPLLQIDSDLLDVLHRESGAKTIAIETNGTVAPKFKQKPLSYELSTEHDRWDRKDLASWLWITMSPKRSRAMTMLTYASELKLVTPAYDPNEWADFPADHYFIQPQALPTGRDDRSEDDAAQLVQNLGGRWRLSLQTHKILGVP